MHVHPASGEVLKIAQVAPLYESVPPARYGGTERVVSYLTEQLVDQGHDVTLFASGDSTTRARLFAGCPRSLRADPHGRPPIALHLEMIETVCERQDDFDVIHFHTDHLHFPAVRRMETPVITTLHGRLDLPELPAIFRAFPEVPLVSISDSQRAPLRWANWARTIHHGIPSDLYRFEPQSDPYLAFIGRISPEKGFEDAIEIAVRAGMPLRVAAKIDPADREYFETHIRHLMDHPLVDFRGEITDREKQDLLGKATAVLFPVNWPEPFGLVMIEAMACGTPVIAYPRGSVPEIIEAGVNGWIVENVDEAVDAVRRVSSIPRVRSREAFEKRFTAARMVRDYLALYESLIESTPSSENVEVRQCR
jgi:glycosyltransferase involved in cell wall biosynthesis